MHVTVAPGASGPDGHDTAERPISPSAMRTEFKVTLPVFDTAKRYVSLSPTLTDDDASASSLEASDFTIEMRGPWGVTVVTVDGADCTDCPPEVTPRPVAVFPLEPASTST